MIRVYRHAGGATSVQSHVDPAWLRPDGGVLVWVDLFNPDPAEARVLSDVFHFHELAVEDALSPLHHPKVESYGDYLYLILHGIDFKAPEHCFRTHDIDFFLGPTYLVTVHDDHSRSIQQMIDICERNALALGEGTAALMHRIVDMIVDNYRPEIDELSDRLDGLEKDVLEHPSGQIAREILDFKRDISSLRRIVQPERDVVARLARREFPFIDEAISYRFRDVHDHLVRLADEAMFFQDRVTSLLDAHLSSVSNQLNSVMKILTVIATVFMPLTFITGLYGMNVDLPRFGLSAAAMFWVLVAIMLAIAGTMLLYFRSRDWI
ncbi:MAG TPA: magnesium/cobalt transporter CorA [Vicinamibacterales bacterium]|nr:magnesium/cobalt transporter CorA [Vicinamibacterales bacterium]